jgi:hypothetical protein
MGIEVTEADFHEHEMMQSCVYVSLVDGALVQGALSKFGDECPAIHIGASPVT